MGSIPLYSSIPFVLMLLSIALLPLLTPHFWESNKNKLIVSLILGIPTAIYLIATGFTHALYHSLVFDYVPFMILLGGLFVITGGIFVDGDVESKPMNNAIMIGIGGVLASFMGTTGAAMLMIRPVIHTIERRNFKVHIILFFIAVVANCGGLLTPIGDPPLFMMYLRGAPFEWFFRLTPEWFVTNILLLIIFYFVDNHFWNKETEELRKIEKESTIPIKIKGTHNFIFLIGVVASVAFLNKHYITAIETNHYLGFIREAAILAMAILSMIFTKKETRKSNQFTWHPIEEVAFLFLGIFITMVPCILYLEENANHLGVNTPVLFYYFSGGLSSFLDNTPTAVTFYSLAEGLVKLDPSIIQNVEVVAGIPAKFMIAISTASVFFGAMTYIGNGPNFMVKAIAEHSGIKMPHFFEYMYKFSLIVLLPIFIIIQLIFL